MAPFIASLLLLCAPASGPDGAESYLDQPHALTVLTLKDNASAGGSEFTLGIRLPFLGGKLTDESSDKWSDAFDGPGLGVGLRGAHFFGAGSVFSVAPYLGFSFDWFNGKDQDLGSGVHIEQDALTMFRISVGVALREDLGKRFFLEQYLGIGVALYNAGDADISAGGLSASAEAIENSAAFLLELGLRAGFQVTPSVALGVGVSFEMNGAPGVGDDLKAADFDYESQQNVVVSFFLGLNF